MIHNIANIPANTHLRLRDIQRILDRYSETGRKLTEDEVNKILIKGRQDGRVEEHKQIPRNEM